LTSKSLTTMVRQSMEVMQCLPRSLLLHGVLLDFRQRGRVSVDLAPILGGRKEETVDRENC
jgi:hypothetical protein